jgi:hypothetical protein
MLGYFLVFVYEDIGMEDAGSIPRIAEDGFSISVAFHQLQVFGILYRDEFAAKGCGSSLAPSTTAGREKQGNEYYVCR